ncbi:STAS/SEC14 domain-containing protein [Shewanella sp. OPT22]|nr:STAS/SEC14 domain-containing protein [Shewanella sp. OPT22]
MSEHGLFIDIERTENHIFVTFKAIGKLKHDDYEKINPILDKALKNLSNPNIDVLLDASQLEGWELRAAWDDIKIGIKYAGKFNKIAIVTHKNWLEVSSKIANWFIASEIQTFESESSAIDWLKR